MKKLIAILLVSSHLFSLYGRAIVHQYMVYQSDKFYNEQAAKGKYNVRDLTEVVIPVHLENISNWNQYETVSGQIQFGDHNYNYVKMKLTHHAMYLLCVPDYQNTQLLSTNIIDAKAIKNMPVSKKEHVPVSKSITINDLQYHLAEFNFTHIGKDLDTKIIQSVYFLPFYPPGTPEQPPKFSC